MPKMTQPQREQAVQKYVDNAKILIDRWRALHPDDADHALLAIADYAAERRTEAQYAAARALDARRLDVQMAVDQALANEPGQRNPRGRP